MSEENPLTAGGFAPPPIYPDASEPDDDFPPGGQLGSCRTSSRLVRWRRNSASWRGSTPSPRRTARRASPPRRARLKRHRRQIAGSSCAGYGRRRNTQGVGMATISATVGPTAGVAAFAAAGACTTAVISSAATRPCRRRVAATTAGRAPLTAAGYVGNRAAARPAA